MSAFETLVERSLLEPSKATFMERVRSRSSELKAAVADGELDNEEYSIGLEMEIYAVERAAHGQPALTRLPKSVFDSPADKELGLHNAELNTEPDIFSPAGLSKQAGRIERALEEAQEAAADEGCELVLDAMWTTPPAEGSEEYLTAVDRRSGSGEKRDVVVAENMRPDARYVAIDNDVLRRVDGAIPFDVPGLDRTFPTILFESLATSIQPHLQIPSASDFPDYYTVGIRTLGPILALSTNSPLLPPDLYTDLDDPYALLEATHHELRIQVFEQSVNQTEHAKVRVPADIDSVGESIDNVVEDDLVAPFLREWLLENDRESFADDNWEFTHKRSTFWRWLRCVIGGDSVAGAVDERSLRIEYRPIPTQPTVADVLSLQALVAGTLRGLVEADHPVATLPWDAAKDSFYNAAVDGLSADLAWIDEDGTRTDDTREIMRELFEYARRGLNAAGFTDAQADDYLAPLEARVREGMTPSQWKLDRVRKALDDGEAFEEAVATMQAEYIDRSRETATFADWL